MVVFSGRTTRNAAVHWMKYSPGTSNVRPGNAGDLMAGGVHCCHSGWASKHLAFLAQAQFKLIWCFGPQRIML